MAGGDTTFDLEVPTPAQAAELRRLGVQLPSVSAQSADARGHSDFVDRRLVAVGFGIYLGGFHLYVDGVALPIFVPQNYVSFAAPAGTPGNLAVFPSRADAERAAGSGPGSFGYYRSYAGLIVPTLFTPTSTPRTCATMRQAMADLGNQVAHDLVAFALSYIGIRILSGVYSRLIRASQNIGTPTPVRSPVEIGARIGNEVRSMPGGRRVAIAQRVTAARLGQADAATATGEASRVAFGRIGGTVRLPNNDLVVPSVQLGENQPVFLVRPNGSVVPARATISQTQPLSLENPITLTNIRPE